MTRKKPLNYFDYSTCTRMRVDLRFVDRLRSTLFTLDYDKLRKPIGWNRAWTIESACIRIFKSS